MTYRYIGNKTRLLPWIIHNIRDIVGRGATVADLMCGTATVSEALRLAGYRVIASDIMTFAVQHAQVRLSMDKAPTFSALGIGSYIDVLWELQNLGAVDGYIVQEYSPAGQPGEGLAPRAYFSYENAAKLDGIRKQLNCWKINGLLSTDEATLLHHDLVLATNRVANIAGTYGHFRSKWSNGSLRPLQLKPTTFIDGYRTDHIILQGYAENLAQKITADVCYIDPPYMKRQYAANYHIIETIARGDEPEAIGVSGLRPWRDQYSNFCSKIKAWDAFSSILQSMNCTHFLISYSEDGLLPLEDMKKFFQQFGEVNVFSHAYPRFRSNDSALGAHVAEYLFHIRKG